MFVRPTNQPVGFAKGNVFQPQATPSFGGTPSMNPMASGPKGMQGLMGRIAGMGQQFQQRTQQNMDDPRKRQLLAYILSNGGMNNALRG